MEAIWKTTRIIGLTCCFGLIAAVSVDRVDGTDQKSGQDNQPQKVTQSLAPTLQTADAVPHTTKTAALESADQRTGRVAPSLGVRTTPKASSGIAIAPGSSVRRAMSAGHDDCVGAIPVTTGSTPFDNTEGTVPGLDATAPVPCNGAMFDDIWFVYTATCTGDATIASGCDDLSDPDTTLEVYNTGVCPPAAADTIGCSDDACGIVSGFASIVTVGVTTGNDYLIRLGGWQGSTATGNLVISCETGPDTCALATVIPELPFFTTGGTCNFNDDYTEICPFAGPPAPDVVYKYTPTADQECIDINTCLSDFDTKIYVYENDCQAPGDGNLPHACNDDTPGCGNGFQSLLQSVFLTGGNTYYIVVDGFGGQVPCGDYTLFVSECIDPPPNDDCADRMDIFDGDTEFTTAGSSTDGQGHPDLCDDTADVPQTVNDIWYNYVATCNGTLSASTCNQADYDSDIVIYGGAGACDINNCPPGSDLVVACNDDAAGCANFTSTAAAVAVAGACYKIRLGGWNTLFDFGSGTLTIACNAAACGDGACNEDDGENCANCPADCGRCCGNDICDSDLGENCVNCGADCGVACDDDNPCTQYDLGCGANLPDQCTTCGEPECPASSFDDCGGWTLTQSAFPTNSPPGRQVACGIGSLGQTTENSWARCFNLEDEGVPAGDGLTIRTVTFGVSQATIDGITVIASIYTDSDGCPPPGPFGDGPADPTLTLVGSASTIVGSADVGTFITLRISPPAVIPAGTDFIVDIETPNDGTEPEGIGFHAFRSMANSGGQCARNYLRAADCGIPGWIGMDQIGFADIHLAISVNEGAQATLIIKQGASGQGPDCTAPVNPNSNGVLPILLVGEDGFDVADVNLLSLDLHICGEDSSGVGPIPSETKFKDLNHPTEVPVGCADCQCNANESSDGIDDLSMKFSVEALQQALGLTQGAYTLELTGTIGEGEDETGFCARDCILVVPPGTGNANATFESNVLNTLIAVTPMDMNFDIDGFANFSRSYLEDTMVTLTAPSSSGGRRFLRWRVDGEMQGFGIRTIDVTITADTSLKAFYQRPTRVMPELPTEGSGDME